MLVHISTVGYYGVHYKDSRTIEVDSKDLSPCDRSLKIRRARGFVPVLLSEETVQKHALPSAVAWRTE